MRESKMASIADGFPFKNTSEVEGEWGWGGRIAPAVPFENCGAQTMGSDLGQRQMEVVSYASL